MTIHHPLFLTACRTLLLPLLLVNFAIGLSGCDKSLPSNNTEQNEVITTDTTDVDSTMATNDQTTSLTHMAKATESSPTTVSQNTVSPSGYQNLSFGQIITPELLVDRGLIKEDNDNEQCYYVHNPKLTYIDEDYIDKNHGERGSVLYQIIDGKVALITVQDPAVLFYTGVAVGNAVGKVMLAHDDDLAYEVDKYAVEGDYYNLISNINFKTIRDTEASTLLTSKDIKLDNKEDKVPLQIKYRMKDGQELDNDKIDTKAWTAENKTRLKGQVKSIDIGIPEAIYLVEGCS